MGFDTQVAIIAQNSATAAAAIVAAVISTGSDVDAQELFTEVRRTIFDGTMELAATVESGAPARTSGAFRGPRGGNATRGGGAVEAPATPAEMVFNGGKHKGRTIADVYADTDEDGPGYIEWTASDRNKNAYTRKYAGQFLASV